MGTERADVVVIGAGLAGSAVAWALASRGRVVSVIEAFPAGHRRGSSHGSARISTRSARWRRCVRSPPGAARGFMTAPGSCGWHRVGRAQPCIRRTRRGTPGRDRCRRGVAGAAARRPGPAAVPGRDPAGRVPPRPRRRAGTVADLHLSRRDHQVRPAGRAGRGSAGRGQDRRARQRDGHHRRRSRRDRQPRCQGPDPRVRQAVAWWPGPRARRRGDLPVHLDR